MNDIFNQQERPRFNGYWGWFLYWERVLLWATPYGHTHHAPIPVKNRTEAVSSYEKYLNEKIEEKDLDICGELNKIYRLAIRGDVTLIYFCKPLLCHGDVIKRKLEEKVNEYRRSIL